MRSLSPRQILLVDGVGALVSAAAYRLLLARRPAAFGLPGPVCRGLAAIPSAIALWDFGFACRQNAPHAAALRWTARANLAF